VPIVSRADRWLRPARPRPGRPRPGRPRPDPRPPRRANLSGSDVAGIVVLGVVGLAIAAVLALLIGHGFSLRDPSRHPARLASRVAAHPGPRSPAPLVGTLHGTPFAGTLRAAPVADVTASCGQHGLRPAGGGRRVDFFGDRAVDGRLATAWRCGGDGIGRTLTLQLRDRPLIAAVGLVPGFAATDPITGRDGFVTDRRVLRVQWSIAGKTVVQTFDPTRRQVQTLRIPATRAGRVTMTVLATTPGRTDVVAVSEVALSSPATTRPAPA